MSSRRMFITIPLILLFCMSGCNLAAAARGEPGAGEATTDLQRLVNQAIQQTLAVQTQVAMGVAQTVTAMAGNTPEFTIPPPGNPTLTLTLTPSSNPTLTFTFTPETARVSVSVGTNCRSGPGPSYDLLGVLPAGQMAEAVGRNAANDTWVIKLPSNPASLCWLWGQYASMTGNWQALPIVADPPTPTPRFTATPAAAFNVDYEDTQRCDAAWISYNLKLTNTGSTAWQSNRVEITDLDTLENGIFKSDAFAYSNGCTETSYNGSLFPGQVSFTYGNLPPMNPHNHLKAVVRLCTEDGMQGTCLDRTITFSP